MSYTLPSELKRVLKRNGGLATVGPNSDRYIVMAIDNYEALLEERSLAQTKASSDAWSTAFNQCVSPIFQMLTQKQLRQLVDFRLDSKLQRRISTLLRKNNAGTITSRERAELHGYCEAGTIVSIFQAKARILLKESGTNRKSLKAAILRRRSESRRLNKEWEAVDRDLEG